MKERFYYLKEKKVGKGKNGESIISWHKKGVVVLIKDENGDIGKGISVCNPVDRFRKTTVDPFFSLIPGSTAGRQMISHLEKEYFETCKKNGDEPNVGGLNRARGRALRALRRRANTSAIGREHLVDLFDEKYKSIYDPELSPAEIEILSDDPIFIKQIDEFDPEPELSETTVV